MGKLNSLEYSLNIVRIGYIATNMSSYKGIFKGNMW